MNLPTKPAHGGLNEVGALRALLLAVRARILSGLIAALPIALTFFIVRWLYVTIIAVVLMPPTNAVRGFLGEQGRTGYFWETYGAPVIAVLLLLGFLYFLGFFVQTRFMRVLDWGMLKVPIVNTIFKATRNVFDSVGKQIHGESGFKRVVLVEFPQPGMRSLGFVTNSLSDVATGQTILCVTVLTGVMPPSGFTLFVPEDKVTDVDWSMNETLQAILSGGITAPATIHYTGGFTPHRAGPLVDTHGHPLPGGSQ